MTSDLAIFNFDGPELDSGTVVEYMIAKMVDMPSVVLRTDFRCGGDQVGESDQWNLMCSSYPRTRSLLLNSMQWYQRHFSKNDFKLEDMATAYAELAEKIILALDRVRDLPSVVAAGESSLFDIYAWATKFPGGDFASCFKGDELSRLVQAKIDRGVY